MFSELIGSDGTKGPTHTFRKLSEPGTSPLAGAWELVSDEWEGMMLMTDTQYRYLVTRRDRPQIAEPVAEMSDADAASLYHSFDAQGGSYVTEGSTITRRPAVARDPREQGIGKTIEFTADSNALTTRTSQDELAWRRLE